MKNFLVLLFFLLSLTGRAQSVSGLFSGNLVNDSTKKVQHYELALSEYRDKITGYSYTTFVINDTFYYSVKRVRAIKNGTTLIVTDEKMLVNNFPESPAKGVKQINTIPLTDKDTIRTIDGKWETTQTKKYYALQGAVSMQRDDDSSHSPLIAHLMELKIINQNYLPIIPPSNSKKPENIKAKTETSKIKTTPQNTATLEAIPYNQRQQKIIQTLDVASDSLVLSFYDNGVVDGDIISVYLNDQNILSNLRLKEAAAKKTIHLPNNSSYTLLLVAENLGSLPPNTGLVIVQDGDKKYQINFSANLQTNAAIVIRKKNQP